MKAAVMLECGKPLKVLDGIEIPALLRGQLLVALSYSGVCHSQLMEIDGCRGEDKYLPHLLGHEGSGRVIAVGEGVTKVKTGDEVVLGWIKGNGIDAPGPKYRHGDILLNAGAVTTFNTHAVVSENRCVKIPSGVPMDIAALFGCAVPTGAGIVFNELKPESGKSAVIFGIGGIGSIALMSLNFLGCSPLIAVDVEESKLREAKALGASHAINASSTNVVNEILALTGGSGVDYAVDAAGKIATIQQAFAALRYRGGRCVFASHPPKGQLLEIDPHDLISGKEIKGSWGGACCPDTDLNLFAKLYKNGSLKLDSMITKKYKLEEINIALNDLKSGMVMRPIIDFSI